MDLYHVEIGLPANFVAPTGRVPLRWTEHANRARKDDRYGEIPAFKTATLGNLDVIEVGMVGDRVAKILFRGAIDSDRDMCIVLVPGREWTVKTVWVNLHSDTHRTLDRSKYVC